MFDSFNRKITYLRISVTDRCNLRCTYCIPEEGIPLISHQDILSFEEIVEFTKTAVSFGIEKVRITGGEPLVRKNVVSLVGMLSDVAGIKDLGLTTNGIYLEQFALPLKQVGLKRINISLDTMNPERYREITKTGHLLDVLNGIEAAQKVGFHPIKINCVVQNSSGEKDAREVETFCREKGLEIRFIKLMNLKKGIFSVVEHGEGGHCETCNRLRLTANGKLKPCLFSDLEFDIRQLGYSQALKEAIKNKPKCGKTNRTNLFSNIGG